jgi:hypothetical protein
MSAWVKSNGNWTSHDTIFSQGEWDDGSYVGGWRVGIREARLRCKNAETKCGEYSSMPGCQRPSGKD